MTRRCGCPTETIYQSLYVQSRGALRRGLAKCLRTGRGLRQPNRQGAHRKSRVLPDMINIAARPGEADDRAVSGNEGTWPVDDVVVVLCRRVRRVAQPVPPDRVKASE
jgi:IS30 family transposase